MFGEAPGDDATIPDDAILWRRIHPDQVILDSNLGRRRPSNAALRDEELSVILAEPGRDPQIVLANYPGRFLVSLPAGTMRDLATWVVPPPEQDSSE